MNCGFDFSADPQPSSSPGNGDVAAVEAPQPVVGGRSAPALLVMIAVAAALLLLVVAALLLPFGGSDVTPTAGDARTPPGKPAPTEEPVEPSAPTCWDGTPAQPPAQCPEPSGAAGLTWVFPSLDPAECADRSEGAPKPAKWVCTVSMSDGDEVRIRYREHKSVEQPLATYSKTYGTANRDAVLSARDDVERYVWRASEADGQGRWSLSSMYAEYPWSVTIKGTSANDVEVALTEIVKFRKTRRLDG